MKNYNTLSEAVNDLSLQGYTEDFVSGKRTINGSYNKIEYSPDDLIITSKYHFGGDSDPGNSTELYVIEANDGTKGTMVVSYAANEDENTDLIRELKFKA